MNDELNKLKEFETVQPMNILSNAEVIGNETNESIDINHSTIFNSSSSNELTAPFEAEEAAEIDKHQSERSNDSQIYEQTEINIEQPSSLTQHDNKKTIKIQILNAPVGISIEEINDSCDYYEQQHGDMVIQQNAHQSLVSGCECELKVGIELTTNLNMPAMISDNTDPDNNEINIANNENSENEIKIRFDNDDNKGDRVQNLTIVNSDELIHVVRNSKIDQYGIAIELNADETNNKQNNETKYSCETLSITQTSTITTTACSSIISEEQGLANKPETVIHMKKLVRNRAIPMYFKYEQCDTFTAGECNEQELDMCEQKDESEDNRKLIETVQMSVLVKPNIEEINDENEENLTWMSETTPGLCIQVEPVQEDLLEKKPDKNLLLWLNYPHLRSHIYDEFSDKTDNLDEKLDYLYEKIKESQDTTDLSNDMNLVQIEKVLSLFISNQEKIESDYELISTLEQTRPELQSLILKKNDDIAKESLIVTPKPNQLIRAECLTSSFTEEPLASTSSTDLVKIESLIRNSSLAYDSIEQLTRLSEDNNNCLNTSSKVVFNLPSIGKLAQLDETTVEFYDPVCQENVCEETVELICLETIKEIVEKTSSTSGSVLASAIGVRLDHSFETIWDIDPRKDMLSIIQEIPIVKEGSVVKQVCMEQQPIEWENASSNNTSLQTQLDNSLDQMFETTVPLSTCIKQEIMTNDQCGVIDQSNDDFNNSHYAKSIMVDSLNNLDNVQHQEVNYCHDDENNKEEVSEHLESFTCTHDLNRSEENRFNESLNSNNHLNACEQNSQHVLNIDDTYVVNLNNTLDDDLGSFIEQIEKYELISDHSGRLDNISECQPEIFDMIENQEANLTIQSEFILEKEKLNRLTEQIEVPKWEELDKLSTLNDYDKDIENAQSVISEHGNNTMSGFLEIHQPATYAFNESLNDADNSLASEISSNTSKIHLIESVEIVTHHISNFDEHAKRCECKEQQAIDSITEESQLHIHKVDFNRLQIREKKKRCQINDLTNRFRVDFKQEEAIDLRDFECDDKTEHSHQVPDVSDKVFAKKFVDQIVQLNNSKLNTISCSNDNVNNDDQDRTEMDETVTKYDTLNFGRLTGKSSLEILESLHNLKDIGKHLTESVYNKTHKSTSSEYGNKLKNDLKEINEFLINNERSSIVDDTNQFIHRINEDDEDSLKDGDGDLDGLSDNDIQIPIESKINENDNNDERENLFETKMMLSPTTSISMMNRTPFRLDAIDVEEKPNQTDTKVRINRRY